MIKLDSVSEQTEQGLKPCPFCGGEADIYSNENEEYKAGAFGYIRRGVPTLYKCFCKSCGAIGPIAKIDKGCENNSWWQKETKKNAIKAWNRRADNG